MFDPRSVQNAAQEHPLRGVRHGVERIRAGRKRKQWLYGISSRRSPAWDSQPNGRALGHPPGCWGQTRGPQRYLRDPVAAASGSSPSERTTGPTASGSRHCHW